MLPEIIYRKASEEFGTIVGVAKIFASKKKTDYIEEINSKSYKKLSNDLDVNWIIAESVIDGKYKELQKEIYRLKSTNKRLKSELSIYKRAYDSINGKNNQYKSKLRKVYPNS
jgi:hypothetical protein